VGGGMNNSEQGPTPTIRMRPSPRRGMTMVELAVALSVMIIGGGAAMYGLICVSVLARVQSEHANAFQAARNVLEALQSEDFPTAFARFNATTADDPAIGASPGNAFDAAGLDARPGDLDGRVGSIEFPGDGVQLLENVIDAELGMPRDLGGAPGVDPNDHAPDYALLPVLLRVQWRGAGGIQQVTLAATLSNDKNVPGP
jgi:type II secretory pathway pseudopilin PulG